jgi:general secretion pathway protein G
MKRSNSGARRLAGLGFTLIELLLVLVILSVLAAIIGPRYAGRTTQARIAATKADIAVIDGAMEQFEIDNGRYPRNDEGVAALVVTPLDAENWHGPYLNRPGVPRDAWKNPYVYEQPGQYNVSRFDLHSLGPDGREGNDDIGNWGEGG